MKAHVFSLLAALALTLFGACAGPSNQHRTVTPLGTTPLPKPPKDYFTVGSTMDEVVSVMGTPARLEHSPDEVWWYYDQSRIVFRDGHVFAWDNYSNNLKVRWNASAPVASRATVTKPASISPVPAASPVSPASPVSHPYTPIPAPDTPKASPPPQANEGRQIADQVTTILAGKHSPLPAAVLVQADASASYAEIAVKNETQHNLTVLFSGPTPRNAVILSNVTLTLVLGAGTYRVAATMDDSSALPFAGSQEFHGGNYTDTFPLETEVK